MADLENTAFKYTVKADGSVDYTAMADGKPQNLSGRNISSKEALEQDLSEYTIAYVAGLRTAQVQVGSGLTVGKMSAQVEATEV